MVNNQEGSPVVVSEKKIEYLSVRAEDLGFHYTVDSALRDAFKYGLLSRMEERKRGLNVRKKASRSIPNAIYFTTRINDLYFLGEDKQTLDEKLNDVVGIAIDRPDYARGQAGHFAEDDFVGSERFKALVFVDVQTFEKPFKEQEDAYDTYRFGDPLPGDYIRTRIESLKKICQKSGVDIPIYGVSGDMYWPERRSRAEIREMLFLKRTAIAPEK